MEKDILCKSCKKGKLKRFLELGEIPPVNSFLDAREIHKEKAYPLNLAYCDSCLLVQLEEIVPPENLFSEYLHLSSASVSNIEHLKKVTQTLNSRFKINKDTKVLEIGSNDGTLLSFLKEHTPKVIGVDPAKNLKAINQEKGIEYFAEFFNSSAAETILKEKGYFDIIIALNVVPHTPNVVNLLEGVYKLLSPRGVFVMEGAYALETILKGEFDTIYHEHVYSFSFNSLISTFKLAKLKVVDVEKIPTQGGSLRVYAQKEEEAKEQSPHVYELMSQEIKEGLTSPKIYEAVKNKVGAFKNELRRIIDNEKRIHGKLIGLGAPARGVVILNYCNLGVDDIDYLVDDTFLKQNKVSPGVHIPVKSWDAIIKDKKTGYFLLSWNYRDYFISRLKEIIPSFKIIIPFPKLEVKKIG